MPIGIMYRPELKEYDFGAGHPFRGDRYELFPGFLRERLAEENNYRFVAAEPATEDDLLLICSKEYIDFTRQYYRAANLGLALPENFHRYHSQDNLPGEGPGKVEEAARLMIGQVKMAADLVQAERYEKIVNIGGNMHHAKPNYGEGFCLYNDNAFVARYLIQKYGLERILVLDTDAHQGNGTAEYFYDDPRVLFIDLHQDPSTLYPGIGYADEIGAGAGKGHTVNIPMPVRAGIESYRLAFEAIVEPMTEEYRPQIIVRNGGSDPHFSDGLTSLGMTVSGFQMIGDKVRGMAKVCGGRVIDIIGSGYNREVLPHAWLALIAGLADFKIEPSEPFPIPERFRKDPAVEATRYILGEVKRHLKDYWACLR